MRWPWISMVSASITEAMPAIFPPALAGDPKDDDESGELTAHIPEHWNEALDAARINIQLAVLEEPRVRIYAPLMTIPRRARIDRIDLPSPPPIRQSAN